MRRQGAFHLRICEPAPLCGWARTFTHCSVEIKQSEGAWRTGPELHLFRACAISRWCLRAGSVLLAQSFSLALSPTLPYRSNRETASLCALTCKSEPFPIREREADNLRPSATRVHPPFDA